MAEPNPDLPIRILHLSDIHFRAARAWDEDPVLRSLTRFVAGEVAGGLVPDLVAVTGDLAFGGKAQEYRLARDWLETQLWPGLSVAPAPALPQERLLLVPGNHDVDRDAVDFVAAATQAALLKGSDQDSGETAPRCHAHAGVGRCAARTPVILVGFPSRRNSPVVTLRYSRKPFPNPLQRPSLP